MWLTVGPDRRPHRLVGLCVLVLLGGTLAGCVGPGDHPERQSAALPGEDPIQTGTRAEGAPGQGDLHILGDAMVDRLARRLAWSGSGTLNDPYTIRGLELDGKALVFEDITRIIDVRDALLRAPDGLPALTLRNVTGLTIADSVLSADAAPALHLVGSRWCRIAGNTIHAAMDAVVAEGSEAIDLVDNDLRAGARGATFVADFGNHWLERNRIQAGTVGVGLHDSVRSSILLDNDLTAATGVAALAAPGPLLDGNRITAATGVLLEDSHEATLVGNTLDATTAGIRARASDGLYAHQNVHTGDGTGVAVADGALTLLTHLNHTGPGPAVHAEGGRLVVVLNATIDLGHSTGDALVFTGTHEPIVLATQVNGGNRSVVLERTTAATLARNVFLGAQAEAVTATATTGTLVAENIFDFLFTAVRARADADLQVYQNDLRTVSFTGLDLADQTGAGVSFNLFRFIPGTAIAAVRAPEILIDHNRFEASNTAIRLQDVPGALVLANAVSGSSNGIVLRDTSDGLVQIRDNRIQVGLAGIHIDDATGFEVRGNTLFGGAPGLRLNDALGGLVFDNYFDNDLNVAATGRLGVTWEVVPSEGPNIAGGPLLGGNWWHDYAGADADGDGFGDVPYGMLPYSEDGSAVLSSVPSYGVRDRAPLASDAVGGEAPTAQDPVEPEEVGPPPVTLRLERLLGLDARLDALLGGLGH